MKIAVDVASRRALLSMAGWVEDFIVRNAPVHFPGLWKNSDNMPWWKGQHFACVQKESCEKCLVMFSDNAGKNDEFKKFWGQFSLKEFAEMKDDYMKFLQFGSRPVMSTSAS